MTFNTIEDINGTQFDNQGFWWYELDTAVIDPEGTAEFTDAKVDFCNVTKIKRSSSHWQYNVKVDNILFAKQCFILDKNGNIAEVTIYEVTDNLIVFESRIGESPVRIYLYMGVFRISSVEYYNRLPYLINYVVDLSLKELNSPLTIEYAWRGEEGLYTTSQSVEKGYNEIKIMEMGTEYSCGYLLVKLLKTDFQFLCNQQLTIGEVNTVSLGTDSDYKPLGDLVGDYETKLSVLYNNKTLPVVWNESLNDYTFDLDLTNIQSEGKIKFKVIVETNDVLNASETDVVLDANYQMINTIAKLQTLLKNGGTGRLTSSLTLNNDLTLSKSVNLIGNLQLLNMNSHKIVVPANLTFKATDVIFTNGVNTIQQEPNSTVELTQCNFADCTGFGSVIDCQVDIASLSNEDDFNTKLTNCFISNCDMAILSGGNLEVDGCTVIGKISNKNYPYFLYQTDGNATILNSEFNLTDETVYNYDIEFNSCIFTCGETATINGYSHTELQQNNRSAFLETQRNTSTIDVQYYYSLIEANVHLQSSKGFCHSVSGVDFVYKTNITLTRGE